MQTKPGSNLIPGSVDPDQLIQNTNRYNLTFPGILRHFDLPAIGSPHVHKEVHSHVEGQGDSKLPATTEFRCQSDAAAVESVQQLLMNVLPL